MYKYHLLKTLLILDLVTWLFTIKQCDIIWKQLFILPHESVHNILYRPVDNETLSQMPLSAKKVYILQKEFTNLSC